MPMAVVAKWFAELLILATLPILAFQSVEMIQAFLEMIGQMSEWMRK